MEKEHSTKFITEFNGMLISGSKIKLQDISELVSNYEPITKKEFWKLEEFNPPSFLPNGNVGTPSHVLMDMVSRCKLPTSVLKSLKINTKPTFNNVSFNYEVLGGKIRDDNSDCEEDWERHIQFHNDVDQQARTEERPYETEKEIVWEKGSSGLVHYTDIQYWNEKAGKNDFDEDTVDDWDVDTAMYADDPSAADRDAVELFKMRETEYANKHGVDFTQIHAQSKSKTRHIGAISKSSARPHSQNFDFERHTKGLGRKLLEKYGWVKGQPINKGGLIFPLDDSNRKPKDKSGIGYFQSLTPFQQKQNKTEKLARISTIYDNHEESEDTPIQSAEPTIMKYRKKPQPPTTKPN